MSSTSHASEAVRQEAGNKVLTPAEIAAKMAEIKRRQDAAMVAAAKRYAAADRTDPFALQRQLSYVRTGLASYHREGDPKGVSMGYSIEEGPAYADAEPFQVKRTITGWGGEEIEYYVTEYRNVRRP